MYTQVTEAQEAGRAAVLAAVYRRYVITVTLVSYCIVALGAYNFYLTNSWYVIYMFLFF